MSNLSFYCQCKLCALRREAILPVQPANQRSVALMYGTLGKSCCTSLDTVTRANIVVTHKVILAGGEVISTQKDSQDVATMSMEGKKTTSM